MPEEKSLEERVALVSAEYVEHLCEPALGIDPNTVYMAGTPRGEYLPLDLLRATLPEAFGP